MHLLVLGVLQQAPNPRIQLEILLVPEPQAVQRDHTEREVAEGWVSRIINAAYSNEGSDNYSQGSFRNISPEVRKTAHQTSIYFKH